MTGVGAMLAGDGPYSTGGGSTPLTANAGFTGGAGPINVSGASGNMGTAFGYKIAGFGSGGSGSYPVVDVQIQGDASGKLSQAPSGDGLHTTIAWTGFLPNEGEGCYITVDVTDSLGATASARYPESGYIIVKRTS